MSLANSNLSTLLAQPRTLIMGIINATPDSFSDGGLYADCDRAVEHGLELVEQGADLLDVGGESTRPGAHKVSLQQELDRVIPVIEKLSALTTKPISIDSYKPEVMLEATKAGASMINDVNGLRADGAIRIAQESGAHVCIMHMLGDPKTMQNQPEYDDVVEQVTQFLRERIKLCLAAGIERRKILLDPGIGFGKSLSHNLQLLAQFPKISEELKCEMLIGVSRKSMIDKILGRETSMRVSASVGLAVQAAIYGAKIVRVHDVAPTFDAIRCVEAVKASKS